MSETADKRYWSDEDVDPAIRHQAGELAGQLRRHHDAQVRDLMMAADLLIGDGFVRDEVAQYLLRAIVRADGLRWRADELEGMAAGSPGVEALLAVTGQASQ